MDKARGKVVVVTGASAGIGSAVTAHLVRSGATVVGFARSLDKMEEMRKDLSEHPGTFHPVKVDVTNNDEIRQGFAWIRAKLGTVHVLVNNAGCMAIGKLLEGDPDTWKYTFDLNVLGLTLCAQEAVRLMRDASVDSGLIINMNSTAGHIVPFYLNPRLNMYPASKFALTAINQTLRQELRFAASRIRVTSISPGYVSTNFALGARNAEGLADEIKGILGQQPSLTVDDIAEAVLHIISLPDHVQVDEIVLTAV